MQAQRLGSVAATRQGPPWHPVQRPRLQDGTRRHRVETEGFRLPFRPLSRLAQNEEPGGSGGEAGRGRGLGRWGTASGGRQIMKASQHRRQHLLWTLRRELRPMIGGELSEPQKLREARVCLNLADSGHGPVTCIVAPIM